MKATTTFLAAVLATALAAPALASTCTSDSTPGTDLRDGRPEHGVFAAGFYVFVDDACANVDCFTIPVWVYEETNGIPGLQRSDWWDDDTCGGAITADRWIF